MTPLLRFDEERHEYYVGEDRFPSVTEVLDPLSELDGIPRETLAAAAAFGSNVHRACHLFNQGRLDEATLAPPLRPYLDGWRAWLEDSGAVVIASEIRCFHPALRYAGTADVVVRIGKRTYVIDLKSGQLLPRTVGLQLAAYREALVAGPTPFRGMLERMCIHLRPSGYATHACRDGGDFNVFLSALNLLRWRMRADA